MWEHSVGQPKALPGDGLYALPLSVQGQGHITPLPWGQGLN